MQFPRWPRRLVAAFTVLAMSGLAVTATPAGPAHAAGHVEAYVWANQPATPQYLAATGYEHSSAGQPIVITRIGVGFYSVRFHGLASPGGVAHASAYGNGNGDICTVYRYLPRGADQLVWVRCFDGNGVPSDSRFVANFTDQQAAPGHFGYLFSHDPAPAGGWYHPAPQWSYDSAGQPIVVNRTGVGHYEVNLGAVAHTYPGDYWNGYFRATAVGSAPVRCEVMDPRFYHPPAVPVICYDQNGVAVDSPFTLTYANGVNLLGSGTIHAAAMALPQPAADPVIGGWSSLGGGPGVPTATRLGVGDYVVSLPGVGLPFGHAMANAFGTPPQYCTVAAWWPAGAGQQVRVNCWNAGGVNIPTDVHAFNLSFTR